MPEGVWLSALTVALLAALPIDILFANAGIQAFAPTLERDDALWLDQIGWWSFLPVAMLTWFRAQPVT